MYFSSDHSGSSVGVHSRQHSGSSQGLPSCYYCENSNQNTLVYCAYEECGFWFCNEKFRDRDSSCLYIHLMRTYHSYLILNIDIFSDYISLECYKCGCRNCFALGYKQGTYGLYCRYPCATIEKLKGDQWEPLFPDKFLTIPNINFDYNKKSSLPSNFGNRNDYSYEMEIFRIKRIYESKSEYQDIFNNLLLLEREEELKLHRNERITNVMLYTTYSSNIVYFYGNMYHCKFKVFSKITLKYGIHKNKGRIKKIIDGKFYVDRLLNPINSITQAEIYIKDFRSPTEKLQTVLNKFEQNSGLNEELENAILGQGSSQYKFQLSNNYSIPNRFALNKSQNKAITTALSHNLSLISGPPGTGKTETITALINHIYRKSDENILVCAFSNVAITLIKKKLIESNIRAIQVVALDKTKEYRNDKHTLHYQTKLKLKYDKDYQDLILRKKDIKENIHNQTGVNDKYKILEAIERQIKKYEEPIEEKIIQDYKVICVTCVTSNYKALGRKKFEHIIVDEACQAKEVESLVSFLHSPEHIVLVGDQHQLGAIVKSFAARKLGFGVSLFQRLISIGYPNSILNIQYRMHPQISKFSNQMFYESKVQNGISNAQRALSFDFPSPINRNPVTIFDIQGSEENASRTIMNRFEAEALTDILNFLYEKWVDGSKIGIISFYSGQVGYIQNYLSDYFNPKNYIYHQGPQPLDDDFTKNLNIMSVDSCQGKEYDYVILSCVRSHMKNIGFLDNYRRLNVALTRAKRKLIVLGNVRSLLSNILWHNYLYLYRDFIVTGNFYSLNRSPIVVKKPRTYAIPNDEPYSE